MKSSHVLVLAVSAAMAAAMPQAWGHRADPAPADDQQQTLKLGDIEVKGQENVVKMLQAIKKALRTPYSDSPEHADDLVCRINRKLGEASKYLDCATNRDYSKRRDATQNGMLAAQSESSGDQSQNTPTSEANREVALHNMVITQPDHRLYVPVGSNFERLLRSISPPSATTASAPAVGTVTEAPQAVTAVPAAATVASVATTVAPTAATIAGAQPATASAPPVAATIATVQTSVAVAMPSETGKACSQLDVLRAAVHRAIYAALKYPAEARYYASTGVTAISYVYLDGHVDDIHVDTPSGDRMLDRVALNAVKRADYPSSGGLAGKPIHDVVYVIFDNTGRLQRNSFGAQRDSGEEMNKDLDSRCNSN